MGKINNKWFNYLFSYIRCLKYIDLYMKNFEMEMVFNKNNNFPIINQTWLLINKNWKYIIISISFHNIKIQSLIM